MVVELADVAVSISSLAHGGGEHACIGASINGMGERRGKGGILV